MEVPVFAVCGSDDWRAAIVSKSEIGWPEQYEVRERATGRLLGTWYGDPGDLPADRPGLEWIPIAKKEARDD